jgi:type-F conjugative transfer system pilin assembly protein TrbC
MLLSIKSYYSLLSLIILPYLCLGNTDGLEDLISSKDSIVKKHMQEANKLITEINLNALRPKLRAEAIIINSKANCKKYGNWEWFNELNLQESNIAVATKPYELYIFVSLSMPMLRLIDLLKNAKNYGGMVILRGLKNNSYKETTSYLQEIIKQAGAGLVIEPNLFSKYHITKVPAFVLNDPALKKYDKITGNVTLQYALEEISRSAELKEQAVAILSGKP